MSIKAIFTASALAACSMVNGAVLPIRQAPSSGPTCEGKLTGTKFVTKLTSNVQFEVVCGADYYGSDLSDGIKWPGSFEGCLAACDNEPQCKAVSWANGPCYLKGGVPILTDGNTAIWTAKKNPPPTCEGSDNSDGAYYTTSAGNFEIICGKDYGGNDLPGFRTNSFSECIDACAANEECVDVSYEYGACYPKKALGELNPKGSVWTAKFLGYRASPSSSVATSTPTPEVAKALSCIDNADDTKTYKEFTVECGVDHGGADIGAVPTTTTFEECMDACEANGECVVVSWVWGTCYMKNAKNDGQTGVGHVWGAARAPRIAVISSAAAVTPSPSADSVTVVTLTPSADSVAIVTPAPSADSAAVTPTPSAESAAAVVTPTPSVDSIAAVTPTLFPDSAAVTPVVDSTSAITPSPSAVSPSADASSGSTTPTPTPSSIETLPAVETL